MLLARTIIFLLSVLIASTLSYGANTPCARFLKQVELLEPALQQHANKLWRFSKKPAYLKALRRFIGKGPTHILTASSYVDIVQMLERQLQARDEFERIVTLKNPPNLLRLLRKEFRPFLGRVVSERDAWFLLSLYRLFRKVDKIQTWTGVGTAARKSLIGFVKFHAESNTAGATVENLARVGVKVFQRSDAPELDVDFAGRLAELSNRPERRYAQILSNPGLDLIDPVIIALGDLGFTRLALAPTELPIADFLIYDRGNRHIRIAELKIRMPKTDRATVLRAITQLTFSFMLTPRSIKTNARAIDFELALRSGAELDEGFSVDEAGFLLDHEIRVLIEGHPIRIRRI